MKEEINNNVPKFIEEELKQFKLTEEELTQFKLTEEEFKQFNNMTVKNFDTKERISNNVPKLNELIKLDKNEAKKILLDAREKFTIKEICKVLGCSKSYYYSKLCKILDIPKMRKGFNYRNNKAIFADDYTETIIESFETNINEQLDSTGFQIMFSGEHTTKDIENRLTNILLTMDKEKKYKIKFVIEEIEETTNKIKNIEIF